MSKIIKLRSTKYPGYETIVDDEDYEELTKYKWHPLINPKSRTVYALRQEQSKNILMHRHIMNKYYIIENQKTDHEDHNGLNNQKENLRICTSSKNNQNVMKTINKTTSKHKGVYFAKHTNRFCARINLNNKQIFIGYFINEDDAGKAYNEKAKELFGEFACLNIIKEEAK